MTRFSENLGIASGLALVTGLAAVTGIALAAMLAPAFGSVRPVLSDEHMCIFQVPEKPEDPFVVWGCAQEFQMQARKEGEEASRASPVDAVRAQVPITGYEKITLDFTDADMKVNIGLGIFGLWMLLVTVMAFRKRTKVSNFAAPTVVNGVPQVSQGAPEREGHI